MLSQIQEPTKLASLEFNKKLYQLFAGEHEYVLGVQQCISDYQDDGNVALLVERLCSFIQKPESLVLVEAIKALLSPSHQILFEELRPFSSNCRTVILKRCSTHNSFGFCVRGGSEFGCHLHVSHVKPSTSAHKSKLYSGDAILSVNNFDVQNAKLVDFQNYVKTHKVLFLIVFNRSILPLETRFGPDLEKLTPKNWVFTESNNSCRSLPMYKVAVFLKDGFGCSLRKEPGKPGIYAANVVPFSVAHELGIRDRDQILFVNSIKFFGVSKTEAVMAFRRRSPAIITFCKSSEMPKASVPPKTPPVIFHQIGPHMSDVDNKIRDHDDTPQNDSWNEGIAFSNTLKEISFSPKTGRRNVEKVANSFEESFKILVYNEPEREVNEEIMTNPLRKDNLCNSSSRPERLQNGFHLEKEKDEVIISADADVMQTQQKIARRDAISEDAYSTTEKPSNNRILNWYAKSAETPVTTTPKLRPPAFEVVPSSNGGGNNSVRSVASDTQKKKKKAPLPPNRSQSFQMPSQVAIRSRETNGLRKVTILFRGFFGIKVEGGKMVESGSGSGGCKGSQPGSESESGSVTPLVIKEIYEESPLKSCISQGDRLVAIDGIQLGDKSISEINTLLTRMERNKEQECSMEILFEPLCQPNPKLSTAGRITEEVTTF